MSQNPEYRRLVRLAGAMNKKATAIGAHGQISAEILLALVILNPTCAYCDIELRAGQGTFDHSIPLDRGGKNTAANLVRSCAQCNRRKFTKTPAEFDQALQLERVCPVDGRRFVPRWGEVRAGRGIVCSRACAARWRFDPRRATWRSDLSLAPSR